MTRLPVLITQLVIFLETFAQSSNEGLKATIVLYRHGDRAPIRPYSYDPYDGSFWPLGLGQLTNIGKMQEYALGQWLRTRYSDFLPKTYNRRDIKVQSSNADRCLMSAQLNLAGLYPPEGDQIWSETLKWRPIPIHTIPEEEDAILAQRKPCPKYTKLYQQLMETEPFQKILKDHYNQMQYFWASSGDNITTLEQLQDLYDIVYIENIYFYLPAWTSSLLSEEVAQLCADTWATYTYTTDLARLRSGPIIDLILDHFENVINNVGDNQKFLMLSGDDSTIAPLLTAMGVFDYTWPDYASAVLFELRERDSNEFVNVFYKNYDEVANLTLPDCDFDCDFQKFQMILEPIRIGSQDWDKECQDDINTIL